MHAALLPLLAWLVAAALAEMLQRREFAKSAEKASRYRRLPLVYKALCFVVVVPLFTAIPLALLGSGRPGLAAVIAIVAAPASYLMLEITVVGWYKKHGFL